MLMKGEITVEGWDGIKNGYAQPGETPRATLIVDMPGSPLETIRIIFFTSLSAA